MYTSEPVGKNPIANFKFLYRTKGEQTAFSSRAEIYARTSYRIIDAAWYHRTSSISNAARRTSYWQSDSWGGFEADSAVQGTFSSTNATTVYRPLQEQENARKARIKQEKAENNLHQLESLKRDRITLQEDDSDIEIIEEPKDWKKQKVDIYEEVL